MIVVKYIFAILLTIPIALIGWYFYEALRLIAAKRKKSPKPRKNVEEREAKNE